MSPLHKAYGFSLGIHATMIVALYVIPAASTERFSSSGQRQVISLDFSQATPATTSTTVSLTVLPTTPLKVVELTNDPATQTESLDRQLKEKLPDPLETEGPNLPKLASRPRSSNIASRPPVETAVAVEQFAGLEEKTSADLSKNQPPGYPLEAVRRKLEGVVVLRLRINAVGKVESVEVIESSGHRVLDQAAIDAVAQWEGKPAKRWGRPIESIERLPIRFRL